MPRILEGIAAKKVRVGDKIVLSYTELTTLFTNQGFRHVSHIREEAGKIHVDFQDGLKYIFHPERLVIRLVQPQEAA